jgi:hypothetical protein
MAKSELHNVEQPVSATVSGFSLDSLAGAAVGLIEFRVPISVLEGVHLGETWILSRRSADDRP